MGAICIAAIGRSEVAAGAPELLFALAGAVFAATAVVLMVLAVRGGRPGGSSRER